MFAVAIALSLKAHVLLILVPAFDLELTRPPFTIKFTLIKLIKLIKLTFTE